MDTLLLALEPASRPLLQALLNALWQGVALAAAAALLLRILPGANAATRHLVWCAALLLVAVLPLLALLPPPSRGKEPAALSAAIAAGGAAAGWSLPAPPDPWPLLLLALLGAVAALRLGFLLRELRGLRRLKRLALPLGADRRECLDRVLGPVPLRGVRVGASGLATGPVTIGFRRPMILFPDRLVAGLSEAELRQVALHELAHLRRRDDWTNLGQRILEAALWFHPAVRWIGRRIELEREIACDDQVVAALAENRSYALCLTRLAELAVASRRGSLAPGAAPGGSQLARRVGALLAPDRPATLRVSLPGLAAALAVLLGGTAGLRGAVPALALAERLDAAPATLAAATAAPAPAAPPAAASGNPAAAPPAPRPFAAVRQEADPLARLAASLPEPRMAAGCGPGLCGSAAEAPAIVERARLVPRPARAERVARGPAVSRGRAERGPAVEITVALPFATGAMGSRSVLGYGDGPGWSTGGGGPGGLLGALGKGVRFRVLGGGGGWRPYAALPGRR